MSPSGKPARKGIDRAERLAKALRENLRRRKEQARAKGDDSRTPSVAEEPEQVPEAGQNRLA